MIRAILFDIDGVLINSEAANRQFYRDLLKYEGYPDPPDGLFENTFYLTGWEAIEKLTGEKDDAKIRKVWEKMSSFPYPAHLVTVPAGARETLKQLKNRSYLLGLVTGRVKAGLEDFYEIFGLYNLFDTAVVFEDYKHAKPHPEPIQIALKRLKVAPDKAVYVGDSLSDQDAAHAAGVTFIAFNNSKLTGDANIILFSQLIPALNRINAAKTSD